MKVLSVVVCLCALAGFSACDSSEELTTGQLVVTDLVVGTGVTAAAGDSIKVFYVLTRTDDNEICDLHLPFDGQGEPQEPVWFSLDAVIPGFRDGMIGAKEGGRRRVVVPPNLGYGLNPPGGQNCIRSNEFLDFTVDLVEVRKP